MLILRVKCLGLVKTDECLSTAKSLPDQLYDVSPVIEAAADILAGNRTNFAHS